MKKILLTRLVPLLMMAWLPLSLLAVNSITYYATYDPTKVTMGTDTLGGVTYTTVSCEGLYNDGEPSLPSLPVDYIKLSVPYNATNFTVTATLQNNLIGNINHLVYPCQYPRMMNDTTPVVIALPNDSVYNSGSYYPSRNAWVVDEGFLAGENHIVTVAVMPLSFRHRVVGNVETKQLRKSQTVRIVLSYDLTETPAMTPIIRQDTTLRQEGYALTRSMVANPNNVMSFAPTEMTIDSLDLIIPSSGGGQVTPNPDIATEEPFDPNPFELCDYPYVVITTNDFHETMSRFAALKRQKGNKVRVVTMDEVIIAPHSSEGDIIKKNDGTYHVAYDDNAGKLRQYLKNACKYWGTRYVLLAGDGIPFRTITMYPRHDRDTTIFQSDWYYSDLNADWAVGEFDSYPELYVGRIIAKDVQQINNYIDKLYRYELNPGRGDNSYLKNAFYSQGYDMRIRGEVEEIRSVLDSIYPTPFVMEETDSINKKESFPSGRDIVNELNENHYSFISLHHHGEPSALLTCGYRNGMHKASYRFLWAVDSDTIAMTGWRGDDTLTGNGLNNITNKDYPNICYSIACTTMPFEMPSFYEDKGLSMNFGESFTTGKDYGGPIFIGNTNNGFVLTSARLETSVFKQVLQGYYKLGVANGLGKACFSSSNKQMINYVTAVQNLLGDPTLELWTDIPQVYHDISITRTDHGLTISRIDLDSTNVSYCDNNGNIGNIQVDSSVNLTNVSPNASVMVYRHNCIPYIAPMLLQNFTLNNSQYVIASDFTAGASVDNNRTSGDVIVKSGVNYEIEASGTTTLQDGFKVEAGATFSVIPSSI